MHFPGRRGTSEQTDFHLYPLSFYEVLRLKESLGELDTTLLTQGQPESETMDVMFSEFEQYLVHGGYLTAINDMARDATIRASTLAIYHEWIRGDVLKRGKQENYLREVLSAIIHRYGSQITWNALAQELSIDHPKTVSDYVELLATMDAVFVQPALREDTLSPAPKKAKKVVFTDPFIFHAIRHWLRPSERPFEEQINPAVADSDLAGRITEGCVAVHFGRLFPTYYIKAEGEVDVAFIREDRFWPIEVKWTGQLRVKDLKQIRKYGNGVIWSRSRTSSAISGVPVVPLPLGLAMIQLLKH
jgi:predicted AAA+ superfamily ATPase